MEGRVVGKHVVCSILMNDYGNEWMATKVTGAIKCEEMCLRG